MEPTARRTLAARVTHETAKVRGSRFIGDAAMVTDEAGALDVVAQVRQREPAASHHCWAFRLVGGRERSSDDGEPTGTAGAPILRRIGGADLSDVVVVVTRYFGGTKLGTGGLVRAYGGCAAATLAAAQIDVSPILAQLRITHDYELTAAVDAVLSAHDAAVDRAEYGQVVTRWVSLPATGSPAFAAGILDATAGRVVADPA